MKKFNLSSKVIIGLSEVSDGDIRNVDKSGQALAEVRRNQARFLKSVGLRPDQTVLVRVSYDDQNFRRFLAVGSDAAGQGMIDGRSVPTTDGLATTEGDLGLFLPLADCLGAVIFDRRNSVLMVSHLGRHATEQNGASGSIDFLEKTFGTDPADIHIWLSPSAGAENYPLFAFAGRSLREVNVEQFAKAGVNPKNIVGDHVDTTTSPDYFSHSQRPDNQRFAVVAFIRL